MDKSSLVEEIRTRLGSPSTSELTDEAIGYAIDAGLSEVSRLQPYYTYNALSVVKNVNNYTLPSTIVDVKDVWVNPSNRHSISKIDSYISGAEAMAYEPYGYEYTGLKVFHSPSLLNIIEEKWERQLARSLHSWEFNPDTNQLLLIPAPTKDITGMYKGTLERTLSTIAKKYENAFKDLVRAYSMETQVFKVSGIKSIPVGVGKVDYETDNSIKMIRDLKRDAINRLTQGGSAVVIG